MGNGVAGWVWFVVPFGSVLLGGLALYAYAHSDDILGVTCVPVEVALESLDPSQESCVRVEGMAHYRSLLNQTVPATIFSPERTFRVFGLFAKHDTTNREIRVLVRTERPPERLVTYEIMTLEGRLGIRSPDKIPFDSEVILGKKTEYFFSDEVWVLEPFRITSDGEAWTAE